MHNPVIIIQGATGSGKSSLAEKLAVESGGEIISADSRQIYKYLDIGTAKPELNIRKKIQYHLIDIVTPDKTYNAGQFRTDCLNKIKQIQDKGKIPIITGGTGFYISALLKGLAEIPEIKEETRRKVEMEISQKTPQELHRFLTEIDPVSAKRIETNDLQRQQRALEVYFQTGKPLSEFWENQDTASVIPHVNILVERNRQQLYSRINSRVDCMIKKGLLIEFLTVVQLGYNEDLPGMKSVGYRELFPWLKNEITLEKAVAKIKQHTRNYAKRQFTWYRRQEFHLTFDLDTVKFSSIRKDIENYQEKVNYDSSKS